MISTVDVSRISHAKGEAMDQLDLLMTYTVFHLGMYATLCALLISLLGVDHFKPLIPQFRPYLMAVLLLFLVAAIFGGLVGSSLPYYDSFDEFSRANLGPWGSELISALTCTHLEHSFFWAGVLVAVVGFCICIFRPKRSK
jgi:hypothetical protein